MEINMQDLKDLLSANETKPQPIDEMLLGKQVIVRTYSAGVHYGTLAKKSGSEVILKNSRRLYFWKTNGGISLSEVALTGLHDDSKICAAVNNIWLDVIEIIPCTSDAIRSIDGKANYV